jgi:predicted anti-sigma-YlaC factor YlaD
MNCTQCREQLFEHIDGTLSAPGQAEFAAHLAACPACAGSDAAERAAAERFAAAAGEFSLPPGAHTRLAALLQETKPACFRWWRLLAPVAAAAGIVAFVVQWPSATVPPLKAVPVAKYEPVEAQDFILGARPLGIGHTRDGVPYRFLRCVGLRREVWKKTDDGSEVAIVVPQEQIIVAKMAVY